MVRLARVAAAAALGVCASMTSALAHYPERPIRFIVTFPPGGSTDFVARVLQPYLEKALGQPIVIDNRGGAGGVLGVDTAVKSAADGYTIVLGGAGAIAINTALGEKMPYDPLRDLIPITNVATSPFILSASPSLPEKTLAEVIARARRDPATLSIGHGGNGTAMHLTALLFRQMIGAKVGLVPYRGSGPVISDLIGGHIPLGIADAASALAMIRAGQVKPLAVSTLQRSPLFADVPTFAESGLPGFESTGWFGVEAPAGTPHDVIVKLNAAFVAALKDPTVVERFRSVGAEPDPMTPDEFGAFIRREIEKWSTLMATVGAKGN